MSNFFASVENKHIKMKRVHRNSPHLILHPKMVGAWTKLLLVLPGATLGTKSLVFFRPVARVFNF